MFTFEMGLTENALFWLKVQLYPDNLPQFVKFDVRTLQCLYADVWSVYLRHMGCAFMSRCKILSSPLALMLKLLHEHG